VQPPRRPEGQFLAAERTGAQRRRRPRVPREEEPKEGRQQQGTEGSPHHDYNL